ncbi:DNA-binding response regulator [Betaproteobacteria bacterium]|nr:DNA-binding response regulator [Betaproteobacteria bacterium]GHT97948.1 DNA-binding response regulator [Betaproteobacteria bacterium]GHT99126.1 DNA-binding response regulator [Betaproteobacteria bacterium]GHU14582.1 DNA-binding response regulator [Betaproteobacteria bacterium]GHU18683.1 DNA-binding response regulator [Betaproteobacteria bacterium]
MNEATVEQKIFLVDDDEALRDSLTWMLESHGHKVETYASAEAFLAQWSERFVGCLVLDVRMPTMSGIELFEELQRRHSVLPVIFISGHGDVPMAVALLKKGAVDFIEKPFASEDMLRLIENCLGREREQRHRRQIEADTARRFAQLTAREHEVLDLILAGKLNKQIADVLSISIKTVEVHRARVMEKMGANSLASLIQNMMTVELRR